MKPEIRAELAASAQANVKEDCKELERRIRDGAKSEAISLLVELQSNILRVLATLSK